MIGEKFQNLFERLQSDVLFALVFVFSIFAFSVLYFFIIKFLYDKNSNTVTWVFIAGMLALGIITVASDRIENSLFLLVPALLIIVVCILFTTEVRRVVWRKRKLSDLKNSELNDVNDEKVQTCIEEMIKALQNMSKNDVGAIIVLSNGNIPSQIIDSGVKMDSDISSEVMESVFFPKTPLHDGAMIIDGTKIVAAGCFLPLTQNIDNIPKEMGTRHRAGLGITETIDVVSIIVSEETSIISIAKAGKLTRYADYETLKKTLREYYWQ